MSFSKILKIWKVATGTAIFAPKWRHMSYGNVPSSTAKLEMFLFLAGQKKTWFPGHRSSKFDQYTYIWKWVFRTDFSTMWTKHYHWSPLNGGNKENVYLIFKKVKAPVALFQKRQNRGYSLHSDVTSSHLPPTLLPRPAWCNLRSFYLRKISLMDTFAPQYRNIPKLRVFHR